MKLKTLKDMKLKTLKDIKLDLRYSTVEEGSGLFSDSVFIDSHRLKQEAIKWLKGSIEEMNVIKKDCFETEWDIGYWKGFHTNFKDFFNITEEDLK